LRAWLIHCDSQLNRLGYMSMEITAVITAGGILLGFVSTLLKP